MRRRGYLWCSARMERAANCRDVRTCKSAVEKRNCKCMGRTRERKLKFVCKIAKIDRGSLCDFTVAPHAGAWVEIPAHPRRRAALWSPPTRGRGLKWRKPVPARRSWSVAPHAGAWVEIQMGTAWSRRSCGRPPRGGVGLNLALQPVAINHHRRPPRGGVG